MGSVNHGQGICKPCAFFHREEGCTSGADCEYCHLCPPGEIKRRKKKKQTLKKLLQNCDGLFLGEQNREVNQMMFNSHDIPQVIEWLRENQEELKRVNPELAANLDVAKLLQENMVAEGDKKSSADLVIQKLKDLFAESGIEEGQYTKIKKEQEEIEKKERRRSKKEKRKKKGLQQNSMV
jgi:hypothetical protein